MLNAPEMAAGRRCLRFHRMARSATADRVVVSDGFTSASTACRILARQRR